MNKLKMYSGIFVLVICLTVQSSALVRNKSEDIPGDAAVKDIRTDLKKIVHDLRVEHFDGDALLEQHADKINDFTIYKLAGASKKSPVVYERNHNDRNKVAVILKPSEDHIKIGKTKRTYVALRKAGFDGTGYYVFFIYLRSPGKDEKGAVSIGGQPTILEYDAWVNPVETVDILDRTFVGTECSSSIFIPCRTSGTKGLTPSLRKLASTNDEAVSSRLGEKTGGLFKSANGDPDENVDYFWEDITANTKQTQGMGMGRAAKPAAKTAAKPAAKTAAKPAAKKADKPAAKNAAKPAAKKAAKPAGKKAFKDIGNAVSGMIKAGVDAVSGLAGAVPIVGDTVKGVVKKAGGMATDVVDSAADVADGLIGGRAVKPAAKKAVKPAAKKGAKPAGKNGLKAGYDEEGTVSKQLQDATMIEYYKSMAAQLPGAAAAKEPPADVTVAPTECDEGPGARKGVKTAAKKAAKPASKSKKGKRKRSLGSVTLNKGAIRADPNHYAGWKTLDHAGAPNDTLDLETDAFVGFGPCVHKRVRKEDYEKAVTETQVVNLIQDALRTWCVKREDSFYDQILRDGFVKLSKEKTFVVQEVNKYVIRQKLTPKRRTELSRSVELEAFSNAFKEELYSDHPAIASLNSTSRRVHVLGETALNVIEEARTTLKLHQIKLLRSLVTTLKVAFSKLTQDYQATRDCKACSLDLAVNLADQHYIMALIKFIIHGLGPLDKPPGSIDNDFKAFSTTNAEAINIRVEAYL